MTKFPSILLLHYTPPPLPITTVATTALSPLQKKKRKVLEISLQKSYP